jgi:hypothetical protein
MREKENTHGLNYRRRQGDEQLTTSVTYQGHKACCLPNCQTMIHRPRPVRTLDTDPSTSPPDFMSASAAVLNLGCIHGGILGDTPEHLTSGKWKRRSRLHLEPTLVLALTKIRPRIGVLACKKRTRSSH